MTDDPGVKQAVFADAPLDCPQILFRQLSRSSFGAPSILDEGLDGQVEEIQVRRLLARADGVNADGVQRFGFGLNITALPQVLAHLLCLQPDFVSGLSGHAAGKQHDEAGRRNTSKPIGRHRFTGRRGPP